MNADAELRRGPVGLILAGGWANRLGGGDKGLRQVNGQPLMRRALDVLEGCTDRVIVSANGSPERFADQPWMSNATILADNLPGRPGPLAGILTAMDWAAVHEPARSDILCVPCDVPFLPADLYSRLLAARAAANSPIAIAASLDEEGNWRRHPTIGLWPINLRKDLRRALTVEGLRRLGVYADRHGAVAVHFPAGPGGIDPFFNVNGPDDLDRAEAVTRNAKP